MFRQTYRLLLFICSLLFSVVVPADELRVAVASNVAGTLEELGRLFESETGHSLRLSAGSSGIHYTQIVNGAPFDLFFSADAERPERLLQEGIALQIGDYAIGQLVLWSSDQQLIDDEGTVLQRGNFRRLAIANPAQAPYGAAARDTLLALNLWKSVQPKVVQGENIAQTLQFIESGNAELGFIAASQYEALGARGSAWQVPPELHAPIRQSFALLKDTPAARALVEFLNTPTAHALFERSGYLLP